MEFLTITLESPKRSLTAALELGEAYGIWDKSGVLTIYSKHIFISAN
jgi:hypothetical protein